MDIKDKELLIVGFGRTGEAVCRFALEHGAKVTVSEKRTEEELADILTEWKQMDVRFETGEHERASFLTSDLIIPSPGVSIIPQIKSAQERGIPVLSEVELASLFIKGKLIGITGSNGKSTVSTLTHKILKDAGKSVYLAGNIGAPLIGFVKQSQEDHVYVTELSSFQLSLTKTFHPNVGIFLNISPDHLDWHPDFEDYYNAKKMLLAQMGQGDFAVLNRDDPLVWSLKDSGSFQTLGFSLKSPLKQGCFLAQEKIMLADAGRTLPLMDISDVRLPGRHNLENVMASALAAYALGVSALSIRSSIRAFPGLEHRLEKVLTLQKVDFFNDSKATNVEAAIKSLESFSQRIILILGGRDKGGNFDMLREPVLSRVKSIVLLGEARDIIFQALRGTVPIEIAETLQAAVRACFSLASEGDVVLLAPACTSFDMFRSFEHRGEVFKQEVRALAQEIAGEAS